MAAAAHGRAPSHSSQTQEKTSAAASTGAASAAAASSSAAGPSAAAAAAPAMSSVMGSGGKPLTAEEEKEFREIFNLVDKDKGGSISKKELSQLMTTLGINADENEINLMINEIDKNSDGEIQFEEFVAVMSRKVQATYTADEVKAAFRVFEAGAQPGFVKLSVLENALKTYGSHTLTPQQVKELINQLSGDVVDDMFNYNDYVNVMLS